jgi:hypothetical protein
MWWLSWLRQGDTRQRKQLSRVRIRLPSQSPERGQEIWLCIIENQKSQQVKRLCLIKKMYLKVTVSLNFEQTSYPHSFLWATHKKNILKWQPQWISDRHPLLYSSFDPHIREVSFKVAVSGNFVYLCFENGPKSSLHSFPLPTH